MPPLQDVVPELEAGVTIMFGTPTQDGRLYELVPVPIKSGGLLYYIWLDGEPIASYHAKTAEQAWMKAQEYLEKHEKENSSAE
jgi:hypothetical protein